MENCPACDPQAVGYSVSFPSAQRRRAIENSLLTNHVQAYRPMDETTLWLEEKAFFDHLDYWGEHCHPETWHFQSTTVGLGGELIRQRSALAWEEVVTMRPQMWVNDIIHADRIRMMFQPIVNGADPHTVIGYEMLARGMDEDGKVIPPNSLFAAAKDQNQLFRLDRACRLQGIEAASVLPKNMWVFLNFIPTAIYVPEHCLATTMAAVNRIGLEPSQVVFEVVETEQVDDLTHLRRILEYYRAKGFRYALDDVGQGFNNLDVLQELRPDIVKLDRAWVSGIHLDREKRDVASSVLQICSRIGATPLAEGVETVEEARILAEMGFALQQGYYYGRPAWEPVGKNT